MPRPLETTLLVQIGFISLKSIKRLGANALDNVHFCRFSKDSTRIVAIFISVTKGYRIKTFTALMSVFY